MQLAISEGARRLPREALNQARERPVRTFYALSVPMLLVLAMLTTFSHSNVFQPLAFLAPYHVQTLSLSMAMMFISIFLVNPITPMNRCTFRTALAADLLTIQ